jgi:hypothetical protein
MQNDNEKIDELVDEHKQLKSSQKLMLAVQYSPVTDPDAVNLLEVIDNYELNDVSPERDFMKAWVAQNKDFALTPPKEFYLVLTNPSEFQVALQEDWNRIEELRQSLNAGQARLVYADGPAKEWWEKLGA